MPPPPHTTPPPAHPEVSRSARRTARLAASAIRSGRASAEAAFDGLLPLELREVADHYWTPLPVVRRAAQWLRETRVRHVVDIGSGAGKFCVAAALLTRCRVVGVEHRQSLVTAARELAATFDVHDRVTFVSGGLDAATGLAAEAYYLFNPFGDYAFDSPRFADPDVSFSAESRARDLIATAALLSRAPAGTFAITYNGFGGKVPLVYEQVDVATRLPGTLRLWKRR